MPKELNTLLKEYKLSYPYQYFDMIIESRGNGQTAQADNQFLAMKVDDRKSFILHLILIEEKELCEHFIWKL